MRHCRLIALGETGLVGFWSKQMIPRYSQCLHKRDEKVNDKKISPIKLDDMVSALFVLIIGLIFSFLCLLMELTMETIKCFRRT